MTTVDVRPRNGHVRPEHESGGGPIPQLESTHHPAAGPAAESLPVVDDVQEIDLGLPSAQQLDKAIAHASAVVDRQDAVALREAKTLDELEKERDVSRDHRIKMLAVAKERNKAAIRRARAELKVENKLASQELSDRLDADAARALLKRMTNPVAYLALQIRARRRALVLAAAPAGVAVLIGAVQSQEAWSRLWNVGNDVVLKAALYGFEPLFTLPLIAILLFEAATPGGQGRSMKEGWLGKSNFAGDEIEFGRVKAGLLFASIVINVLPHLLLGDLAGLAWFAVPAAIVISLSLVPKLAAGFGQRILNAKTEAELGAPLGPLPPYVAKLARQKRAVEAAIKNGTYRGELNQETNLPSANGTRKTLAEIHGAAGMPDAQAVVAFMSLERGIEE